MIRGGIVHFSRRGARRWAVGCIGLALVVVTTASCRPSGDGTNTGTGGGRPTGTPVSLADCPTLHPGDRDPISGRACVRALQKALRDNGYSNQTSDGDFGAGTKANVVDFQRGHGLTADGIAGKRTRDALTAGSGGSGGGGKPKDHAPEIHCAGASLGEPARISLSIQIRGSGFAPNEDVTIEVFPKKDGYDLPMFTQAQDDGDLLAGVIYPVAPATIEVRATAKSAGTVSTTVKITGEEGTLVKDC